MSYVIDHMEERYLLYDSSEYQYLFGPCDMYMCADSQYLSVWTNPEGGIATALQKMNKFTCISFDLESQGKFIYLSWIAFHKFPYVINLRKFVTILVHG